MSGQATSKRILAAIPATASPIEIEQNWNLKSESNIKICNANDYQLAARSMLSKPLYEYLASGTDDEQTLSENEVDSMRGNLLCNSFIILIPFFSHHRLHSKIGTFVPEL